MGRTHGVHAEITTFGMKFALWYEEMKRNLERFEMAAKDVEAGKISGAVGTFANIPPFVQDYVCEQLGIQSAAISTQVLFLGACPDRFQHRTDGNRNQASAENRGQRSRGTLPQGPEGFQRHAAQEKSDRFGKHLRLCPCPARLHDDRL